LRARQRHRRRQMPSAAWGNDWVGRDAGVARVAEAGSAKPGTGQRALPEHQRRYQRHYQRHYQRQYQRQYQRYDLRQYQRYDLRQYQRYDLRQHQRWSRGRFTHMRADSDAISWFIMAASCGGLNEARTVTAVAPAVNACLDLPRRPAAGLPLVRARLAW